MKLWVDGQCFQSASRKRGIGRYVIELIAGIARNHPEVTLMCSLNAALYDEMIAARALLEPFIAPEHIYAWEGLESRGEIAFGLTQTRELSERMLAHHVASIAPDIALSASPFEGGPDATVPLTGKFGHDFPIVGIFYDAIPLRFPDIYLFNDFAREAYHRALGHYKNFDHILTISEFSKTEAKSLFPGVGVTNIDAAVSADLLALIAKAKAGPAPETQPDFGRDILYVGGHDWRKNTGVLIEAFALLPRFVSDKHRLVFIGDCPQSVADSLRGAWDSFGLDPNRLVLAGHRSDAELVDAYRKALCLVQPSRMEGFGLTALEAMVSETPVLGANAGALPEVINNPDLLFDPDDASALARMLQQLSIIPMSRADSLTHNRAQTSRYSWKRSADIAMAAIAPLMRKTPPPSRAQIRDITMAAAQRPRELPARDLARRFASAEVPPARAPRLFVDITSIEDMDHGTGIQRVVRKICENLPSFAENHEVSLVACKNREGFRPSHLPIKGAKTAPKRSKAFVQPRGEDIVLLLDSSWTFHAAHSQVLRDAKARGAKVYSVIYDLIPLQYPGFCDTGTSRIYAEWLGAALGFADGFICISQAVADSFLALLGDIDFPRNMPVGWWPLGADVSNDSRDASAITGDANKFLMVGTLEPRKGHSAVLDAFEALWAQGHDISLTLLGKPGWHMAELEQRIAMHPEAGRRLHRLSAASDAELRAAYGAHRTLISGSYVEGYGLPIIEGARQGCRILASDIPVFREVAPQGTQFFDVFDPRDLQAKILAIAKRGGGSHSAPPETVSWEQSAAAIYNLVDVGALQKCYVPARANAFPKISEIGQTHMDEMIPAERQRAEISLPFGDTPRLNDGLWEYTVRARNLSGQTLFGKGIADGPWRMALCYRAFNAQHEFVDFDPQRSMIPYALGDGDAVVHTVRVDPSLVEKGAAYVQIGFLQESVDWWPDTAKIWLPGVEAAAKKP